MTRASKYQICISGAARGPSVETGKALVEAAVFQIIKRGHMVLTGATIGLPYIAAKAACEAGGISIGFSPASSRREHVKKYKLPLDVYHTVLYSGFHYTGRDLLLVRSSDAVIMVGGRIGTLHELALSLEEHKPVGILCGSGGMTVEVDNILKAAKRSRSGIIFDDNPERLVNSLIAMIERKNYRIDQD